MAQTPKTPATRAEYDARILRHSWKALAESYRVLRETDALLPSQDRQAVEPDRSLTPREESE